MRDHDDGVVEVDEELLEPADGVEIEMVRRLIEKQDVGVPEQRSCKEDLDLQRTGQIRHLLIVIGVLDTETVEERLRIGLRLVTAHVGVLGLELGCPDAVLIGEVRLCVEGILFLSDLIEVGVALNDRVEDGLVVVFFLILFEETQSLSRGDGNRAARGLELARENLQERGLAGAVGTDDSVAVTLREFDVDVFKQSLFPDAIGYVIGCDHPVLLPTNIKTFTLRFALYGRWLEKSIALPRFCRRK